MCLWLHLFLLLSSSWHVFLLRVAYTLINKESQDFQKASGGINKFLVQCVYRTRKCPKLRLFTGKWTEIDEDQELEPQFMKNDLVTYQVTFALSFPFACATAAYCTTVSVVEQNPNQADSIMKIQKDLGAWLNDVQSQGGCVAAANSISYTHFPHTIDEIKGIMHKNIDEVLKRGENLESLMDKSEDLSATSVQFFKKAKSTNKCCSYT